LSSFAMIIPLERRYLSLNDL